MLFHRGLSSSAARCPPSAAQHAQNCQTRPRHPRRTRTLLGMIPRSSTCVSPPRQGWPAAPGRVCSSGRTLNLSHWPTGSRVIIRRERPHPGAQLTFSDIDGHRCTAFLTDTPLGQLADLEMRHRGHARVEDRIRCGKDTGIRNLPCHAFAANAAWLELALTAADLLCWSQALCFTGTLARTEPATFRNQALHVAGLLVRTARGRHLRLDTDWPWARDLATAFHRLRAAPWPAT